MKRSAAAATNRPARERSLQTHVIQQSNLLWIGVWITSIWLAVYVSLSIGNSIFTYSYLRPPGQPGQLVSDRGNPDYVFTLMLTGLFVLPLSAAFMAASAAHETRRHIHICVLIVVFLTSLIIVSLWGGLYYARANDGTLENSRNPANDPRWCCLYRTPENMDSCPITSDCLAGTVADGLHVYAWFAFKFWGLVATMLFMVVDFFYTFFWFRPRVKQWLEMRASMPIDAAVIPEPSAPSAPPEADVVVDMSETSANGVVLPPVRPPYPSISNRLQTPLTRGYVPPSRYQRPQHK